MGKCGCAKGACSCHFEDSDSVVISGSGSASDPFVATPKPLITTIDTTTLALDVAYSDNEATLSAQALLRGHVTVLTSSGTWNRPVGVTYARVLMIGGGGGGASGTSDAFDHYGGGGGDAGQVAIFTLADTEIPSSAAIVVGSGGAGGAPVTGALGNDGSDGGDTSFDARTVRGGAGGRTLGQAPAHLAPGNPPGQFAVDYDQEFVEPWYHLAPGAGGCGESVGYPSQPGGYSHPGQGSRFPDNTGGGAADGGNGRTEPITKMGGGGGGGGTGGTLTPDLPRDGGDGGLYGGGGGGGGCQTHISSPSGKGGDGAPGLVVVVSW